MNRPTVRMPLACLAVVLGACVGDRPTGSDVEARALAEAALGNTRIDAAATFHDPRAGMLTIDECVRRALATSPRLREVLAGLGAAEANWSLQVLPNEPALAASALFPVHGGDPELEASLVLDLLDLLRIPARRDVADAALRAAVFDAAREIVAIARETQTAYVRVLARDEEVVVRERAAVGAVELASRLAALANAGAARSADAEAVAIAAADAELERDDARVDARCARRELAARIGVLDAADALVLAPTDFAGAPARESAALVAVALEQRLDVRALRSLVEEAQAAVVLAGGVLPGLEVGAGVIRPEQPDGEPRDPVRVGPTFSLPIPWFGKSAARLRAAEAELEVRTLRLEAAQLEVTRNVQDMVDRERTNRLELTRRESELEPRARAFAERARAQARAGRIALLDAIAAEQVHVRAGLALGASRERARLAALALDEAVGGGSVAPPP